MPSTITHSYFTKDLYDQLPYNIRNNIILSRLRMFGQGTDPLMFYLYNKKIRGIQYIQHTSKSKDFFINMVEYMKNNHINDSDSISMLVGFICHYVLDYTIHPFIIYKTGIFIPGNISTYKYNSMHHFMENFIDNYMIKRRESINPYRFPIGKVCFDLKRFNKNTIDTLDYTFDKTFSYKNMGKIYYKSCFYMKMALIIMRRDVYGIKKFFYKLIDTFTTNRFIKLECISYHQNFNDKFNFLNLNHKLWRNPSIYSRTSNESFDDLYNKAIRIAKVKVCAAYQYINGEPVDLNVIFENNSYLTGIDEDLNKSIQFFEY